MRRILAVAALAAFAVACSKPSAPPQPPKVADKPALPPGHPATPPGPPPMSPELAAKAAPLQKRMNDSPRSFEAAAALADFYFENARFVDAVDTYRQALERAREPLALFDELTSQRPSPVPDPKAAGCPEADAARVEANDALARERRDEGAPGAALACAGQAAKPLLAALSRRANALFLVGNVDQALAEYDRVLQRDRDAAEALFFVGALQLNRRNAGAAGLQAAAEAWQRYLKVAPKDHPRRAEVEKTLPLVEKALAAKPADAAPAPAAPPAAAPSHDSARPAAEAHAAAPAPVDLEKAIDEAEAALAKGDGAAAARLYMGAMNARPEDGRVQAGLAASQFLKGSAMASSVFAVAAARSPKAVEELAARLEQKGNPGLARTLRQQLAKVAPDRAPAPGAGQKAQ